MPAAPNRSQGTGRADRKRKRGRGYAWDDSKGRVHSIPLSRHRENVINRKYESPLYDPTAPLAGRDLGEAADRLVGLEFDPQRAALNRLSADQQAQGRALIGRTTGMYAGLAQRSVEDVARQEAIGSRLQTALQQLGAQGQATEQQIGAEADQRATRDAAVRGEGLGGGGGEKLAGELQAQRSALVAQMTAAQAAGETGTANYQSLSNLTAGATRAQGGQVRQQLVNRLANQGIENDAKRQQLEQDAANKRVSTLLGLRQDQFENLVAMRGLNIKSQDLRNDVTKANADRAAAIANSRRSSTTTRRGQDVAAGTQRRGQDVTRRGQDLGAQQRAQDRASREKIAAERAAGKGRQENAQAQKIHSGVENALQDISSDPKLRGKTPEDWRRILTKRGAPPVVVRAASELAQGGLTHRTAQALRGIGVAVPGEWVRANRERRKTPRVGHGSGAAGYRGPT